MRKQRSRARAFLVPVCLLIGACSSATTTPDGASTVVDQSIAQLLDAAVPDLTPGPPLTQNPILITSGVFSDTGNTNLLVANFIAAPGQRCALAHTGACWLLDCRAAPDAGGPPSGVSLGDVELQILGRMTLATTPGADGTYSTISQAGAAWSTGDMITIHSEGAVVPSIDAVLTAPPEVTITAPVAPDGGAFNVSRSADLEVSWTPIQGGVSVTMNQYPVNSIGVGDGFRMLCEFDGSLGTATIPKAILALFETTATHPAPTPLAIGGNVTKDFSAGGYSIHFQALHDRILLEPFITP